MEHVRLYLKVPIGECMFLRFTEDRNDYKMEWNPSRKTQPQSNLQ